MDNWATYKERYRRGEWRDRIFLDMILEDARRRGPKPTLVDIGCGRGFDRDIPLQRAVARAAGWFIGVEPDSDVAPGDYFSEVHRCLFEQAPLRPASVDLAYAIMVLEHLPEPQVFWDKVWEVLKEGGVFWALTIDARHWFCRASLLAETLGIKDGYLDLLLGRSETRRYENYPAYYRSNTPAQVRRWASRFRSCQFVNFGREGQLDGYLPRALRPLFHCLDRQALRRGRPGSLLAIRAVK